MIRYHKKIINYNLCLGYWCPSSRSIWEFIVIRSNFLSSCVMFGGGQYTYQVCIPYFLDAKAKRVYLRVQII
jgi:hypothetical protein